MSEFKQTFNSSLGKKLIMALTGLFLCTFIIVHVGGNLLLFSGDNGFGFNVYANFLTHFPPIEVVAYILYLSIAVHAIYALILTVKNRKARPVGYAVAAKSDASWSSKNMGLLGSILFLFISGLSTNTPMRLHLKNTVPTWLQAKQPNQPIPRYLPILATPFLLKTM
jgi:succinate dehydrogenase / fumarate reductase cytochrome b subunit